MQDVKESSVLRSLATTGTDIPAGGFAGIERLKDVRIENGWVTAKRGAESEPLDEYFSGRKPHIKFAGLPQTTNALVQFCEQYGAVVESQSRTATFPVQLGIDETFRARAGGEPRNTVTFPEAMFWFEQWRFRLLLKLAADFKRGIALPRIFENALKEAEKQCLPLVSRQINLEGKEYLPNLAGLWQSTIRDLHRVLGAAEPEVSSGGTELEYTKYTKGLVQFARQRLVTLSQEDLKRVARSYLERSVNEELRPLRPLLDLSSEEGPELYSLCDNLKQRLYWMLALDLAGCRLPRVCVSCGDLFSAPKENAVYCRKLECRERKRKKRNWEKHKEEYNRSRRRKYKAERLRETRRKRQ